jgi:hypothetical protein
MCVWRCNNNRGQNKTVSDNTSFFSNYDEYSEERSLIQRQKRRELERKIDLCFRELTGTDENSDFTLADRELTARTNRVFARNGLEKTILFNEGQVHKIDSEYLKTELVFRFAHTIEQIGVGYTVMTTPAKFKRIMRRYNSKFDGTTPQSAIKYATLRILLIGKIDLVEISHLPMLDSQWI